MRAINERRLPRMSHSSRVRGLKLDADDAVLVERESHSSRVRGLKQKQIATYGKGKAGRTPRECVD